MAIIKNNDPYLFSYNMWKKYEDEIVLIISESIPEEFKQNSIEYIELNLFQLYCFHYSSLFPGKYEDLGDISYNGLVFLDKRGCVNKVDLRRIKKEDR